MEPHHLQIPGPYSAQSSGKGPSRLISSLTLTSLAFPFLSVFGLVPFFFFFRRRRWNARGIDARRGEEGTKGSKLSLWISLLDGIPSFPSFCDHLDLDFRLIQQLPLEAPVHPVPQRQPVRLAPLHICGRKLPRGRRGQARGYVAGKAGVERPQGVDRVTG